MTDFYCEGILFDLDGVLIDSDAVFDKHWQRWAAQKQVSFAHIAAVHHGIPAIRTIGIVAPHLDAAAEAEEFERIASTDMQGLRAFDGAYELLDALPKRKWAIATSSPRSMAIPRLEFLGLPVPDAVITIDDVRQGKPAPDPYIEAARALGLAPNRCIVIEDAPAGIEAARTAGATVIAVASTNRPEALAEADAMVMSLRQIAITVYRKKILVRTDS